MLIELPIYKLFPPSIELRAVAISSMSFVLQKRPFLQSPYAEVIGVRRIIAKQLSDLRRGFQPTDPRIRTGITNFRSCIDCKHDGERGVRR